MLLVDPGEFFRVEARRRLVHVGDVEQADHLVDAKNFLVAMRPAQPNEVVEHRLGQVALLLVLADIDGAVALGQFRSVGTQDHG